MLLETGNDSNSNHPDNKTKEKHHPPLPFPSPRPTWHESEAARQLHDPRGRPSRLEDGAVGADVASGQHGRQVVGDGEGGAAAHLHGGGSGGHRGLGAAGGARETGDGKRWLQRVLLDTGGRGGPLQITSSSDFMIGFKV